MGKLLIICLSVVLQNPLAKYSFETLMFLHHGSWADLFSQSALGSLSCEIFPAQTVFRKSRRALKDSVSFGCAIGMIAEKEKILRLN